jgi:uncharacterized protein (TIGR02265 family)
MGDREQPAEDVVFGNTVESLFLRGLASRMTPRCFERVRESGIDLKQKLLSYYPRPIYYACVRAVAEELFPGVSEDQAMFQLGSAFMKGFEETLLGRAMLSAVRLMGPRRALARMSRNFRSSNNYLKADLNELAPGRAELTLNQTSGAPGYFEGVLTAGLTIAGAQNLTIARKDFDGTRCTYDVRWKT